MKNDDKYFDVTPYVIISAIICVIAVIVTAI
jgi:hypothetical protein